MANVCLSIWLGQFIKDEHLIFEECDDYAV